MDKAWKNPIWDGSIPVGPGGRVQFKFEIIPALAPAQILLASMIGLSSATGSFEKTKATFCFNNGNKALSFGSGLAF